MLELMELKLLRLEDLRTQAWLLRLRTIVFTPSFWVRTDHRRHRLVRTTELKWGVETVCCSNKLQEQRIRCWISLREVIFSQTQLLACQLMIKCLKVIKVCLEVLQSQEFPSCRLFLNNFYKIRKVWIESIWIRPVRKSELQVKIE